MSEEERKPIIPPQAAQRAAEKGGEAEMQAVEHDEMPVPMEMNFDPRIAKKMNLLRQEVVKQNWTPDSTMVLQGRKIPYISINKVKANLAPALAKVGVELNLFYDSPTRMPGIGQMSQHWMVTLYGRFIDCETGASILTRTYGVSADSGDKGLKKAQTSALGVWLYNQFLIADNMDKDLSDGEEVPVYNMKNPQETEGCRSKILEHAVKPAEPAKPEAPAKTVKAPAKPAKPAKAPAKAVKTLEAPAKPVDPAKEAEDAKETEESKEAEEPKPAFKPSAIQQRAIDKIYDEWKRAVWESAVDQSAFDRMRQACSAISSKAEATKFIEDFREVKN